MKASELIRKIKKDGWVVVRQTGSHLIMRHPTKEGQLTIPNHGAQEVAKGLELKILKDAGLR